MRWAWTFHRDHESGAWFWQNTADGREERSASFASFVECVADARRNGYGGLRTAQTEDEC